MGLKDSFKRVEEQGRDATRRVFGHARETWEDAERRIRAGMRIHPRPKTKTATAANPFAATPMGTRMSSADPALNDDMGKAQAATVQTRPGSEAA